MAKVPPYIDIKINYEPSVIAERTYYDIFRNVYKLQYITKVETTDGPRIGNITLVYINHKLLFGIYGMSSFEKIIYHVFFAKFSGLNLEEYFAKEFNMVKGLMHADL